MKNNIIIFGKNGQIGSNLVRLLSDNKEFEINAYSSKEVDFSDLKNLTLFLDNLKKIPDFIINTAAYTNVDRAEEEKELTDLINHQAVKIIANHCFKNNVKLIHYSTDYVFDGTGNAAFKEDNIINLTPLNYYGKTKLESEKKIVESGCEYIILRTAWIYSLNGKNFVNTIIKLAKEKETIEVIADQIGSPTYAYDIALYTSNILEKLSNQFKKFPSGIYNLTNSGFTSRYNFASEIIKLLKEKGTILNLLNLKEIKINNLELTSCAKRPRNCVLDCNKIKEVFNLDIRSWESALTEFISRKAR